MVRSNRHCPQSITDSKSMLPAPLQCEAGRLHKHAFMLHNMQNHLKIFSLNETFNDESKITVCVSERDI